jgi:hypothetical protein
MKYHANTNMIIRIMANILDLSKTSENIPQNPYETEFIEGVNIKYKRDAMAILINAVFFTGF